MQEIQKVIENADVVLIGIGDEFTEKKAAKEDIIKAYNILAKLVSGKPWFAVTVNTDDLIYESQLNKFFIVAPCGSEAAGNVVTMENYDESAYLPQWQFYRNWLASTIGKKLCILELGVGLAYPSVIRLPFEKTALLNQKATLVRVHSKLAQAPEELAERSICVSELPVRYLTDLCGSAADEES
ncbi:hypothetical protein BRYFOR_05555 [Marvinbryantia formatexigens DSM 14469]|uniref:Uncharacterized protein n=1 Tax=Marvinbryantia formatexigens DSM 14469 TaxID=478749 RepID=C6LAB3_9FIRM|nr:hypothetical protein [Marvinbryantia formatexigens]EET62520.1 hypothetical protein BRYFOR_05555 [Marvinbryantia formatexigens DSM 14469]UWO24955.1 hypothetical protein NQ534_00200 [Marvinbryantia formatexigens DSM 14469]SDG25192.1 hypothetical protein SAMN05660368_02183 [Marvinbryantia formatexigens]